MANWNPKGKGGDPNEEMLTGSISSRELCVYCDIAKDGSEEDVILILAWAWRSKMQRAYLNTHPHTCEKASGRRGVFYGAHNLATLQFAGG